MILPHDTYSLKPVWWFWFPWALAVVVAVLNAVLPPEQRQFLYVENGLLESLQALVAFAAAGVGLACLRHCGGDKLLFAWVMIAVLGSLYIGLEEISYGQHLLKWNTPELWAQLNDQNETNLHNTSHWLDQKPRQLLTIGVIVGGIVIPLLRKYRPKLLPERFAVIYPEAALFWVSTLVVLSRLSKTIHKAGIVTIYDRAAEVNEFYVYYFVLLYLVMLRTKLRAQPQGK